MRPFEDVKEQLNTLTTSVHELLSEIETKHQVITQKVELEGYTDQNIQLIKEFQYSKVLGFKSMLTRIRELKLDDWAGYSGEVKEAVNTLESGIIGLLDKANMDLADTNNKQEKIIQVVSWMMEVNKELEQMVRDSEKQLAAFKELQAKEGPTENVLDIFEDHHRTKVNNARAFLERYHERKKKLYSEDLVDDAKVTILSVETTLTKFATDAMEDLTAFLTARYNLNE